MAAKEITFPGTNINGDGCVIEFASWVDFQSQLIGIIPYTDQSKEVQTEHGKPEYIETEDSNGNSTWVNIGGHGHHRNICDPTKMVERKEFFKTTLDCLLTDDLDIPGEDFIGNINPDFSKLPCTPTDSPQTWEGCLDSASGPTPPNPTLQDQAILGFNKGFCIGGCDPDCSSNGVAPCRKTNQNEIANYNERVIKHGLISGYDNEIYYTPRILNNDVKYNHMEYKGNLLLPTTIMELGSSVYCDIDDVPFIINQLPPTTFAASFEDMKYKFGNSTPYDNNTSNIDDDGILTPITKYDDKKDSSLNLRAYAEFSCISVVCSNTSAGANQSQLGVEIIDDTVIKVDFKKMLIHQR